MKKEKIIQKGDRVNFDFSGFLNGKKFEGGTSRGFTLVIGSGQFIPGFEEQMVGLKQGEETSIKVTFPKDYHASHLANKEVLFKLKINSIKK